ncbi:hypothetical protein [Halorussus sp. AFM4]
MAPGQVQYHLRRLRKEDAVVQAGYYGKTHVDRFERLVDQLLGE